MTLFYLLMGLAHAATPFAWTTAAVRAALEDGARLDVLTEALERVPAPYRARTLIDVIRYRFPRGLRVVHYGDLHRHPFHLNYPESIESQIEFLHWLHAHPGALVFAEGLTSDLIRGRDDERMWRASDQRWFDAFVPPRPDRPISRRDFEASFDHQFWEHLRRIRNPVSEYPTPPYVALYALGGPRAALLLGKTERIYAAENDALNAAAAAHRRSSNIAQKEMYTMLFREAAALLAVERVTHARGVAAPVVLVMGKAHEIEPTFGHIDNVEFSTITAENRLRVACREALDAKIRAHRRRTGGWSGIRRFFGI